MINNVQKALIASKTVNSTPTKLVAQWIDIKGQLTCIWTIQK